MYRNLDVRSITVNSLQAAINIITDKQTAVFGSFLKEVITVLSISSPDIMTQITPWVFTFSHRPLFLYPFHLFFRSKKLNKSTCTVLCIKFLVFYPKIKLESIILTLVIRILEFKQIKILYGNLKAVFNHFNRIIRILVVNGSYIINILSVTTYCKVIDFQFIITKIFQHVTNNFTIIIYNIQLIEVNHKVNMTFRIVIISCTCGCGIIEGSNSNLYTIVKLHSLSRYNLFSVRIGGCSTASCCLAQFV